MKKYIDADIQILIKDIRLLNILQHNILNKIWVILCLGEIYYTVADQIHRTALSVENSCVSNLALECRK